MALLAHKPPSRPAIYTWATMSAADKLQLGAGDRVVDSSRTIRTLSHNAANQDLGETADATARNALTGMVHGDYTLETGGNQWYYSTLPASAGWVDSGSSAVPVVPANALLDPTTDVSSWIDIDDITRHNSVADMVAARGYKNGQRVVLDGYFTAGDARAPWEMVYRSTGRSGVTIDGGFHIAGSLGVDYFEAVDKNVAVTSRFGISADEAANTVALDKAIAAANTIRISRGTYRYYTITASNKTLLTDSGVTFVTPAGTVQGTDITAPPTLGISGNNITIDGDITIEGNKASNPNTGFIGGSTNTGGLKIDGNDFRHQGTITINRAFYFALVAGTLGTPTLNTRLDQLIILDPALYAAHMFYLDGWSINSIFVTGGTSVDARVRTGTNSSDSKYCKNGFISNIVTDRSVVIEAHTDRLALGDTQAISLKIEEAKNVTADSVSARNENPIAVADSYAFGLLLSQNISVRSVNVIGHNSTNSATSAVYLSEIKNVSIGAIRVTGSVSGGRDMSVRSVDNVHISTVTLEAPVSATKFGYFFDYDAGYAPQKDFTIEYMVSRGHNNNDIEVQGGGTNIFIKQWNRDAVIVGGIQEFRGPGLRYIYGAYTTIDPDFGSTIICGNSAAAPMLHKLVNGSWTGRSITFISLSATPIVLAREAGTLAFYGSATLNQYGRITATAIDTGATATRWYLTGGA